MTPTKYLKIWALVFAEKDLIYYIDYVKTGKPRGKVNFDPRVII